MDWLSIISIILSSISIFISVPLAIAQIQQIKREKPKIQCVIDKSRTSFIEPIATNLGNSCSLLVTLELINKSSSSIEISSINIEFEENKWDCIQDNKSINYEYEFWILDYCEKSNTQDSGLVFPFRMEPYSTVKGAVIFPYIETQEGVILLNVVTPFATTTTNLQFYERISF